ncbi:c-type cytochrome biogenesis protein CcmI [Marinobacter bohaiensis]|uniref:c-type cytochrome biogenesis protein CcmI n=1 Tax=Marinobacter bohaiensis TaxID=2201898 RepID=UPI000DAE2487|nr:c-type cytochrome biogenesis protein CcmI [Marinobacter bohaiensis]
MTMPFWLTLATLIGLALVFVLYPLFFHRPDRDDVNDIRHQNLMAYRSRLAELEAERDAGVLDDETYRQMKDELSGSVVDDVGRSGSQRVGRLDGRKSALAVTLVAVIAVPAVSLWLYDDWGGIEQLEQYRTMRAMEQVDQAGSQEMAALAEQLRARLLEQPDNLEGWAMLGRTYMNLEQYDDAAWAYQQLAGQVESATRQAATAWGLVAQARYFQSQGAMNESVTAAIDKARERNPDEVNALGLLGINAFEAQNYRQAIEYWERIMDVAPDHPQLPSIRQGVAEAYRRLGEPVPAGVMPVQLKVQVSLAESLRDQVAPDTALFVFAQNADGPKVPLAVARLSAARLPVTLTLDDSMAMMPGNTLSSAAEVTVSARLSPSGEAVPQSGDWQGASEQAIVLDSYDGQTVPVVIDQRIP